MSPWGLPLSLHQLISIPSAFYTKKLSKKMIAKQISLFSVGIYIVSETTGDYFSQIQRFSFPQGLWLVTPIVGCREGRFCHILIPPGKNCGQTLTSPICYHKNKPHSVFTSTEIPDHNAL